MAVSMKKIPVCPIEPYIDVPAKRKLHSRKLTKEELESADIFRAMAESAAAVKASQVYDFSCVTPLIPEVNN